jgi:hypothetical protein
MIGGLAQLQPPRPVDRHIIELERARSRRMVEETARKGGATAGL